jgi:hypothetical protein
VNNNNTIVVILKSFDGGVQHAELPIFWTLSIVQYSKERSEKTGSASLANPQDYVLLTDPRAVKIPFT